MNDFKEKRSKFSYPNLFVSFDDFKKCFNVNHIFYNQITKESSELVYRESKMFLVKARIIKILIQGKEMNLYTKNSITPVKQRERKRKKLDNIESTKIVITLQDINDKDQIQVLFPVWNRFPFENQLLELFRSDNYENFEQEIQNQCDKVFMFCLLLHREDEIEKYVLTAFKQQ